MKSCSTCKQLFKLDELIRVPRTIKQVCGTCLYLSKKKKVATKKNVELESSVQVKVINLIHFKDAKAWIITNPQSSQKKTVQARNRDKAQGFKKGQSDIIINRLCYSFELKKYFTGLCLELKRENVNIFSKKGYSTDTIKDQKEYFEKYAQNHYCTFAVGFEEAEKVINDFYKFKEI